MEEVIFRGVIQGYLSKQYPGKSLHKIIFITSVFFALVQFTNIQYSGIQNVLLQIIYAFYMGLFFGALMVRINNVWLLGIVHGVLNMFTVRCEELQGNYFSKIDIGSLLGILLMFSPVLIIYWLLMITNKPKPEQRFSKQIAYGKRGKLFTPCPFELMQHVTNYKLQGNIIDNFNTIYFKKLRTSKRFFQN